MKVVVTGGAGFIGSHLADAWLAEGAEVVVLDDLSTGREANVPSAAELVVGDVADLDVVGKVMAGARLVLHQAASRAVQRSVEDPIGTDRANTLGTLNVLSAARDAGVKRLILASSSSIYGGVAPLPTAESAPPMPKSPYAVSKMAGEHYARVFSELYGLETVALRYFNVFGPRQSPDSAYAAVIPLFITALASGRAPEVHGDGLQSRDFTYIDDVVRANQLAASADAITVSGRAYNIARGESHTLLDLIAELQRVLDVSVAPVHVGVRPGDVRRSQADTAAARRDLGFDPSVPLTEGLARTVAWMAGSG